VACYGLASAQYDQAEPLYRRAIEIGEKALGKDDPSVAIRYNNLADLLRAQGKYDQAEPLFRRAIEIGEKTLGKDHPNLAIRYNNLAGLLQAQGKYDQAEPLYRRAIEIFQTKLGLEHPNTVAVRKNYDRLQELKKTEFPRSRSVMRSDWTEVTHQSALVVMQPSNSESMHNRACKIAQ
jgi:tetratricopeptide (TPR) repeat protein